MQSISTHFNREEFACQCGCGFDTVDAVLLDVLEIIRSHYGCPVRITSGCRCEAHNKAIGGSSGSQHTKGKAADIQVSCVQPHELVVFLNKYYPDKLGVGEYKSWVHIDSRSTKARWSKVS